MPRKCTAIFCLPLEYKVFEKSNLSFWKYVLNSKIFFYFFHIFFLNYCIIYRVELLIINPNRQWCTKHWFCLLSHFLYQKKSPFTDHIYKIGNWWNVRITLGNRIQVTMIMFWVISQTFGLGHYRGSQL